MQATWIDKFGYKPNSFYIRPTGMVGDSRTPRICKLLWVRTAKTKQKNTLSIRSRN